MIRFKKITQDVELLFGALREALEAREEVIFAYIFGSYAKMKPAPLSDVDVAVYIDPLKISKEMLFDEKLELIGIITGALRTDEVDLVMLNETPISFVYQILKNKKILFSKDEKGRVGFEAGCLALYFDTEPLRKRAEDALVRRIEEGRYGYR